MTLLLLLTINFEKFRLSLQAYQAFNLPKVRYIDIPETTIMCDLLNNDVLIVPSSIQCGTEIMKKPILAAWSNLFSNTEKLICPFCSKKISFKSLHQCAKRLRNLKYEDDSNVRVEVKWDTDKYEANKQKVEEIKIKNTDYNYFDFL